MKNKTLKKEQRKVNKIIREANKTWFDEGLIGKYRIKQIDRRVILGIEAYYLFEIEYFDSLGNIAYRVFSDWLRFNSPFFINKLWDLTNNCVIKIQEKHYKAKRLAEQFNQKEEKVEEIITQTDTN